MLLPVILVGSPPRFQISQQGGLICGMSSVWRYLVDYGTVKGKYVGHRWSGLRGNMAASYILVSGI